MAKSSSMVRSSASCCSAVRLPMTVTDCGIGHSSSPSASAALNVAGNPLVLGADMCNQCAHYDRPDGDEQDCRKRARDAEWNFRVSKGYVKDTFWNRLWFRLTH